MELLVILGIAIFVALVRFAPSIDITKEGKWLLWYNHGNSRKNVEL